MLLMPGMTKAIKVRGRNYRQSKLQIQGVLVLPEGWKAQPASVSISVEPESEGRAEAAFLGSSDDTRARVVLSYGAIYGMTPK
jgi:hypothetical protein